MSAIIRTNDGSSAVMSHTLIKRIPVNYTPGTEIMYNEKMLFTTGRTIRDNDMKVFFCALKTYTDNKYDALQELIDESVDEIDTKSTSFEISVAEMSNLIYNRGGRAKRIIESLERMSEMKIHLLSDTGENMGFVNLITGAILSKDRKTIEIGMNKSFLHDMIRNRIQYNFPKMLSLGGINFRLYIAMQQRKYLDKKTKKYKYTNVEHDELQDILNIHHKNAKYAIADAFKEIGINFILDKNNKWFYDRTQKSINSTYNTKETV